MKVCMRCKIEREKNEFPKKECNSDGLYSYCRKCVAEQNKERRDRKKNLYNEKQSEYREKNRLVLREKASKYYYKNRENQLEKRKEYRKRNREKISLKEALKRISDPDRFEKNRERHSAWSVNNRECINKYQREWYKKNKEKRKAHVILNRAIKKAIIFRPEKCSQCDKNCKPDGHHMDYSKPLEVIWLCRACHSRKSPRTVIK